MSTELDDPYATPPEGIPTVGYPRDRAERGGPAMPRGLPDYQPVYAGSAVAQNLPDDGRAYASPDPTPPSPTPPSPDPTSPVPTSPVPTSPVPTQRLPGAQPAITGPEGPEQPRRRAFSRGRRYLAGFSLAGLTGGLFFYCLSLTPSLLPRVWYLQAMMSGVTVAIGYGAGAFVGWVVRSLVGWRGGPRARRWAGLALAVAAVILIPLFGVLGAVWQHDIRELVEASQPSEARYVFVVIVSLLIALVLITIARGLRWIVRMVARFLGRFIPARAATALAVVVVCAVLGFGVTGVLSHAAVGAANSVFSGIDNGTAPGVTEPSSALRSGSPASLVPWSTLGRQGRTFVATGPTAAQIRSFTGKSAMEPIRVYVGLKSANSIQAESTLAVKELERTGAFHRKVIVVATTTGTGWLNPAMIDPLEYMYGGNTAVAAVQYSYLPSWISFIADKAPAQEAGRDLFDAIYDKWHQLPPGSRPKLVVFGESLGSFGGETAFSGVEDIKDRTSGVLWVGPTNSNTVWSRFTAGRDRGSPQWLPVYRAGRTVRFEYVPSALTASHPDWKQPRVVYLQNPSDPIVWWSWELAFHMPDWLRNPHAPDVTGAMHWYPLVTFWQVSADLALATAVPAGHGHTYGTLQAAAAWAALIPPPGWTADRTTALGQLAAS